MRISDWSSDVCSSDLLVSIIWRLRQRRPSTRNIKGLGRRDYATVFGRCTRTERDMVPPRYEEFDRFHFLSRIDGHLPRPPFWHLLQFQEFSRHGRCPLNDAAALGGAAPFGARSLEGSGDRRTAGKGKLG